MCLGVPGCRVGKRHLTSALSQQAGLYVRLQLACPDSQQDLCSGPDRTCFAQFRATRTALRYQDGQRRPRAGLLSIQIQFSETSPLAESTAGSTARPGEQPACSVRPLPSCELQACSPGRLVCSAHELWEQALKDELSTVFDSQVSVHKVTESPCQGLTCVPVPIPDLGRARPRVLFVHRSLVSLASRDTAQCAVL